MQVVQNCSCGVDLHFIDGSMGWSFTFMEFWGTHGDKETANAMIEFVTGMNSTNLQRTAEDETSKRTRASREKT
jgi:hypothetical protein